MNSLWSSIYLWIIFKSLTPCIVLLSYFILSQVLTFPLKVFLARILFYFPVVSSSATDMTGRSRVSAASGGTHTVWRRQQLQPPDSTLYLFPHSFILLQFHIDLLTFSASSPFFFSLLFLSLPSIPMSFRRDAIDETDSIPHSLSMKSKLNINIHT